MVRKVFWFLFLKIFLFLWGGGGGKLKWCVIVHAYPHLLSLFVKSSNDVFIYVYILKYVQIYK